MLVFRRNKANSGFTLVEVLVATAATLLMMLSLAQIFKMIGDSMKQGRASLEMNNRLRSIVYKIRQDLNNLTVNPRPPVDISSGTGYLKIFDGSTTDYTCTLANASLSRFGDFDDILMYTARAGDSWFIGKVPLCVLKGSNPNFTADVNTNNIPDDLEPVAIAAQHAEVAVFMQPLVSNDGNENYDQEVLVGSPSSFLDNDANGIPDAFRLHYRALLIRPDLNKVLPQGSAEIGLPFNYPASNPAFLIAGPQSGLPSPACDMAQVHQTCDLSVRRIFEPTVFGVLDRVAANSLEDLMNPANRFAHFQNPIGNASTTMPLLALTPTLALHTSGILPDPATLSGFLHPAYALRFDRTGEDILATDILAFDVKVYDSSMPIVTMNGVDGAPASSNLVNLGASGSDDVVVTPSDPGFVPGILNTPLINTTSPFASITGYGGYVDLMWGRKVSRLAANYYGASISNFSTEFSGTTSSSMFTGSLYGSGQVIFAGSNPAVQPFVFQPAYDTWTTEYESDGLLQAERSGFGGVVQIDNAKRLYSPSLNGTDLGLTSVVRQSFVDAGTDGLDNDNSSGADDAAEMETRAPYPVDLRGVKVTVRLESPGTRQLFQMSASNEFVTQ